MPADAPRPNFSPPPGARPLPPSAQPNGAPPRLKGRYEVGESLGQRAGVFRFRGLDHGAETGGPVPVLIVKSAVRPSADLFPAVAELFESKTPADDDDVLPAFDLPGEISLPATGDFFDAPAWPAAAWEEVVLGRASDPWLPAVLDSFVEGDWEYVIEELPTGRPLRDAWDDPAAGAAERFDLLRRLAEGLRRLHLAGAVVESLRPDVLVVTPDGQPRLTDLSGLLSLPLPADTPVRATPYTAPELVAAPDRADARADLYGFGALLFALHAGRELTDADFDGPGGPEPFLARFPDAHPLLGRLLAKTFCRDVAARFPTDEAAGTDPTGFTDLIRTLETCGRSLDHVRLEVAAWTTTGMVRTGNEDAFALLHAAEARQDELAESALILLADGMGGYEAGEVAAALAVACLRRTLLRQPLFARLANEPLTEPPPFDLETCKSHLRDALQDANREVYQAARRGRGGSHMGCTAEAVYVNGRYVVVGHVGDSRTYHLGRGGLALLTQDHTLVNRLVGLGVLTPEEAEAHPRRAELEQAVGGHPDVMPDLYHAALRPGDWVVVCSDGLSNQIVPREMEALLRNAASAEAAARRLVNLANLNGATDNVTVVVVRAT